MSGDYTYTVTAQNAETGLMASGWTAPDGMATVTVGGDPVSLTPSGETWLGAWTVPENTPAGNVPVAAEIAATSNYNAANASPAVTDKGAVTATLPLIVLFLACSRFFIAGIASGSIKD